MIKLKRLLLETQGDQIRTTEISDDRFNDLIKTDFYDAYHGLYNFYRTYSGKQTKYLIEPNKKERTSTSSDNLYTIFMSRLPVYEGYPVRSFSVFFMKDAYESFYGDQIYNLYPENGARIAVLPNRDGLYGFKELRKIVGEGVRDIDTFQRNLLRMLYVLYGMNDVFEKSDIEKFEYLYKAGRQLKYDMYDRWVQLFNSVVTKDILTNPKIRKRMDIEQFSGPITQTIYQIMDHMVKHYNGDIERYLSELLNPEQHEIQLKKLGDVIPSNVECYTDNRCLMEFYKDI